MIATKAQTAIPMPRPVMVLWVFDALSRGVKLAAEVVVLDVLRTVDEEEAGAISELGESEVERLLALLELLE